MAREILLGDEAVALGAIHAGLSAGYSYPGTPASEIMEYMIRALNKESGFKATWCVNEKVAYEEALGVSFAGKRTLISMKHVGLNVAADPFMNSAITRINGGLVVVVADDPGMHSSQNEQDSRYYAHFAYVFCFEPSNHQEAYEMTQMAFDISERFNIPVMVRMVTRLSHSRSRIETRGRKQENPIHYGKGQDWTLLPMNARRRFAHLVSVQPKLIALSNESPFNLLDLKDHNNSLGIIASGIGYNYVMENYSNQENCPSLLKVSTYPLPEALIAKLVNHVETVLVIEEGYPLIEQSIKGLFGIPEKKLHGKLTGHLPRTGELSPDAVREALGIKPREHLRIDSSILASRPPQLCQGCPHGDTFNALNQTLESYPQAGVFSDIGCYTLGALPPYKAVDSCVCMGASVSMAKGGAEVGVFPSVAVIGDSTFAHSGITPLLDAVASNINMTVVIVDNASVAMTGGQPTFATGKKLVQIIKGVGVPEEHIRVIVPLPKNLEKNIQVMKEEIEHNGLSVIISLRECIQEAKKKNKKGAK